MMSSLRISYRFLITGIITAGSIVSCQPANTVMTRSIYHRNVNFLPAKQTHPINELEVSVKPIDAMLLDKKSYLASDLDGNYEKVSVSESYDILVQQGRLGNMEKHILSVFQALDDLVRKQELPDYAGEALKQQVLDAYTTSSSFSALTNRLANNLDPRFPAYYNPFKQRDGYLSLFEVTATNRTSEVKTLTLKNVVVSNGTEQLTPLTTEYFEKITGSPKTQLPLVYRLVMPNVLSVPPGQTVVKYVSTPPLNTAAKKLDFQYIDGKAVETYAFNVEIVEQMKKEEYQFFDIKEKSSKSFRKFYVCFLDREEVKVNARRITLPRNQYHKPLEVYAFAMTNWEKFEFGKVQGANPGQLLPKRQVVVPFKKI